MQENVASVALYGTGEKVNYSVDKYGLVLELPDKYPETVDLIVEIRQK